MTWQRNCCPSVTRVHLEIHLATGKFLPSYPNWLPSTTGQTLHRYSIVLTALHVFHLTSGDRLPRSGRSEVTGEGRKSKGTELEGPDWVIWSFPEAVPFERALTLQWGQDLVTLPTWSPVFLCFMRLQHIPPRRAYTFFVLRMTQFSASGLLTR